MKTVETAWRRMKGPTVPSRDRNVFELPSLPSPMSTFHLVGRMGLMPRFNVIQEPSPAGV